MNHLSLSRQRAPLMLLLSSVSVIVFLSACASAKLPTTQMAVAEAAVQQANTTSTSEDAAGELQIAIGKLSGARQAVANKDFERARQLAEEAQVDAQVAVLHARSERSRKAAQESQDAARVLREELGRTVIR